MSALTVASYMTRDPYSVASTDNLQRARALMVRHEVRHLPVVDGESLVGVVAQHDIDIVEAVPGMHLDRVEVARVMSATVSVAADTPLAAVCAEMAAKRLDCVVVRGAQGVEGILTVTDTLRALAELLGKST